MTGPNGGPWSGYIRRHLAQYERCTDWRQQQHLNGHDDYGRRLADHAADAIFKRHSISILGTGNVQVTAVNTTTVDISFVGQLANVNAQQLVASGMSHSGSALVTTTIEGIGNAVQYLRLGGSGGSPSDTVTLTYNGVSTAPMQYTPGVSPTQNDVLAQLNLIPALNGNVSVIGADGGPFSIIFGGLAQNVPVSPFNVTTTGGVRSGATTRQAAEFPPAKCSG